MTEAEWLECEEPLAMAEFLRGRANSRKLRLLACATARAHRNDYSDRSCLHAIIVAELYADGAIPDEARESAFRSACACSFRLHGDCPGWAFAFLSAFAVGAGAGDIEAHLVPGKRRPPDQPSSMRDIFGNPFRPVAFSPSWRTDTALSLAHHMYDSRDFGAMPILADALQDAGCDSEDILRHCRKANGVHVRGCWVVDLVLGRK